ncbi:MAG: asparagine synthase (glutamine-hydrolyzing) [Chloroflexi bacterium]|nr:asparagine synthase (glutamine-hydrolyzing) [Chloroflexota bacterium]
MCGIAGAVNMGDQGIIHCMIDRLAHRGPDDEGIWTTVTSSGDWIGLGSRRLAILDITSAGHMPMSTIDGQITIVFNGEIYNHLQLRAQHLNNGLTFRSTGDTETLLYLYEKFGVDCIKMLNGIFAFALWDSRNNQLVLARDHFGIKPLYYYCHDNHLVFASEIKAILEHSQIKREISLKALHQYLTFLWVPDPNTILDAIYKIEAGHYGVFKDGRLTLKQYWNLEMPTADHTFPIPEQELAAEIRKRFIQTVQSQMLSDVPLGAFLSAGLDSSSIVASMALISPDPIRTYTIAFPSKYRLGGVTLDDTAVARRTAERYGCQHTEIVVEPDVVNLLPKLLWHMDEPTADPALITAYLVNQEARKTVTVLLSGVGGDELFAGYRKYQAHYLAQKYQRIPRLLINRFIEPFVRSLPTFKYTFLHNYVRLAKKMIRSGSLPRHERFLMDSVYMTQAQKESLYSQKIEDQLDGSDPFLNHWHYYHQVSHADFLNQMLYVDCKTFMVSLNLNYNDKMSMASSIEVRLPFLDWEFAQWLAWNVPPSLKLKHGVTKHIFREAMRPILPKEVLNQKKAGFGAPVAYWITHDLKDMVRDILSFDRIRTRGFFDETAVQELIDQHMRGREDWSLQIWQLLTFELWHQQFLD